jgi:hypothetical protein
VRGIRLLAEQFRAALVEVEAGRYPVADCAEIAEELARCEKACAAARVLFAARAAECGEHRKRGFADAHDWMARSTGSSRGEARSALATMSTAAACPEIQDALVAGEVSLAQAGEIVSVPGHEAELLELARTSGLGAVQDAARRRRLEGIDPDELHATRRAAREVVHRRDRLGMVCFRGALPPEVGLPFVNRLDAETDRVWRAARRSGTDVTREQCAADAFVHLVEAKGKGRGRSTDLVLVQDLNAYRRGHAHPGEVSHIVGGGPIPVSVARALSKDSFVKVVLHDGVRIHSVAHLGRHRPAELETALQLGAPPRFDGVTCAELGCDRRYGLQWDHQDPVANGGVTSLDNLQPLCLPHHWEKTRRDREAGLLGNRKERGP